MLKQMAESVHSGETKTLSQPTPNITENIHTLVTATPQCLKDKRKKRNPTERQCSEWATSFLPGIEAAPSNVRL